MRGSADAGKSAGAGAKRTSAVESTTGALVLGGGAWNVASRFIPVFYVLAMSIAAARYLGPDQFGRQSFIAFTEVTVATVCTAGFSVAVARFAGDAYGRGQEGVVRALVRLGWLVFSIGALVGAAVLAAAALAGAAPRAAWLLAATSAGAAVLFKAPASLLTGAQRWRAMTIPPLVIGLFAAVATIGVLALGGGISAMFAVAAVAALSSLAVATVLARPVMAVLPPRERLSTTRRRELWRYSALSSVAVLIGLVVWRKFELFVLQYSSTNKEIGLYTIAFSAASAVSFALQGLILPLFPATATLHGGGEMERVRVGYGRATRLLLVAVLPVTACALALGPPFVTIVYGDTYSGVTAPLVVLLAFLPLIVMASLGSGFLAAVGRLQPTVAAGLVAAVVDIGLAIALVPAYGAVGAAIANSAAVTVIAVAVVFYAWRMLGGVRWDPATVTRAGAASAAGGTVAWVLDYAVGGIAGFSLGLLAGTLVFGLLAAWLRILPADDAAWLDEIVGRLFWGKLGWLLRVWAREPVDTAAR